MAMAESVLKRSIVLAVANIVLVLSCVIFASGFFPYKPFLPGLAQYKTAEYGPAPAAPFDKVVFMVVDALRSDFVFGHGSGFNFVQSLIREGNAIPFTAHATAPTVTMPRVKAITTGSIPSFLDMILNFAESDTTSSLAHQDTWLAQMKAKQNGKLIMYGDDTWLKLFPETFDRADGTSSFFVSDFTEVDNNVTRHVPEELRRDDWSVMIMHYLGMDHIGHKSGPRSVNMLPKQQEMDNIVKQVYTAMKSSPHLASTLFVLCGDHGMNDGGNHGGSAPGETSPALVFMSPKFNNHYKGLESPVEQKDEFEYYNKIEQSDIAPTLAGLLGFPIPLNNLGVFIAQFLPLWSSDRDRIQLLLQNAMQMLDIVKATFPHPFWDNPRADMHCIGSLSSADKLACAWREVNGTLRASKSSQPPTEMILPFLVYFCKTAQELLSSTASNYNLPHMFIGIVLAGTSVALSVYNGWPGFIRTSISTNVWFVGVTSLYGVMMFASSYVEEEQQFWYWITSGWLVYFAITRFQHARSEQSIRSVAVNTAKAMLPLLSLRLLRRWNQSGQKYAGAPDIVSSFRSTTSMSILMWLLVLTTNIHSVYRVLDAFGRSGHPMAGGFFWAAPICTGSIAFNIAFTWNDEPELVERLVSFVPKPLQHMLYFCRGLDLVFTARAVYGILGVAIIYTTMQHLSGNRSNCTTSRLSTQNTHLISILRPLITPLLLLQTRLTNIPTILLFSALNKVLLWTHNSQTTKGMSPTATTLTSLLMAHLSYFALGGTNAISSLDLSLAYNGIASYNAVMVGVLLFIGNWAGPIWWALAGLEAVLVSAQARSSRWKTEQPKQANGDQTSDKAPAATSTGMNDHSKQKITAYIEHTTLLTLFLACATLATMAACAVLRTHLFVWTVFSPKFLYAVAWLVGWHWMVNGVLGGVLVALD